MSENPSVKRGSSEAFDTNEFINEESYAEKLPQEVMYPSFSTSTGRYIEHRL